VRGLTGVVAIVSLVAAGCSKPPVEPLQLDGNLLTVVNQTSSDWNNVEIWLNTYYRAQVRSIPAHSQYRTGLDVFVEGFGHRFDRRRAQITDLRLTATEPGGKRVEIKKGFRSGDLRDVFGGKS
jgi:hypothetical protein